MRYGVKAKEFEDGTCQDAAKRRVLPGVMPSQGPLSEDRRFGVETAGAGTVWGTVEWQHCRKASRQAERRVHDKRRQSQSTTFISISLSGSFRKKTYLHTRPGGFPHSLWSCLYYSYIAQQSQQTAIL